MRKKMNFGEYVKQVKLKMHKLDEFAKNPILDKDFSYNPFQNALSQTYVWIEREAENEKLKLD